MRARQPIYEPMCSRASQPQVCIHQGRERMRRSCSCLGSQVCLRLSRHLQLRLHGITGWSPDPALEIRRERRCRDGAQPVHGRFEAEYDV